MTQFRQYTTDNAPERSRPILEQVRKASGFVPNLMATLAESPEALEAYLTLERLLSESTLSPQEQQVVLLAVSFENQCEYCMATHTVVGSMKHVPRAVLAAIRNGQDVPDERFAALARFTSEVVRRRGRISESELADFLAAGFSKRNVVEVLMAVAQKTLGNYVNHVAATPLDDAFTAAAWTPLVRSPGMATPVGAAAGWRRAALTLVRTCTARRTDHAAAPTPPADVEVVAARAGTAAEPATPASTHEQR